MLQGSFRCQCPLERWSREIPPKELPWSISALELTSPDPLRPDADDVPPRSNRARRAARRQQRLSDLTRRGPQLREVSAVGRIVTVDRQDGERTRLTNNSARYEHVLAHNLWVSFETALPQEQFAPREPASNPLSRMINHSSTLKATLFAPPNQRLGTLLCSLCDDTHSSGPARSRFVLRAQPPGRRDGRHRGEHVGHALYSYRPQCDRERPQQDHFSA